MVQIRHMHMYMCERGAGTLWERRLAVVYLACLFHLWLVHKLEQTRSKWDGSACREAKTQNDNSVINTWSVVAHAHHD